MKTHDSVITRSPAPSGSIAETSRRARSAMLALAFLLLPGAAAAETKEANEIQETTESKSGWSFNFTPVLVFPKDGYRLGGGVDPELKYTLELGGARLSAGARVGGYYAKNVFAVMTMPTMRLAVPVGPIEPYVSFGMGYGWIPESRHEDVATMSRIGVVIRFSKSVAIGVEGTVQKIDGSAFRFPSFGSMLSFDL